MSIESKASGHWTDDELIEHQYGLRPEDGHLAACTVCQKHLRSMQSARQAVELSSSDYDVSFEFLAAQRRQIYARITERLHWWSQFPIRRWASAAATLSVLGGAFVLHQARIAQRSATDAKVSDVQLAREVSGMADDAEPPPTAPLQALFEE
jgi:hypothetical protein